MDGALPFMGVAINDREKETQMTRKLKSLGLAIVAVFALSAIAASAASAAEFFHVDHPTNGNKAIITAENVSTIPTVAGAHTFKAGNATVSCTTAKFEGTEANLIDNGATLTAEEATLTPTYTGCTLGAVAATVTTTGCHFRLNANTTTETPVTLVKQGHATVVCEAGKSIEISAGGCIIKVGSQTPEGGVNYVNTEPGTTAEKDIDAEAHVTHIAFTTNKAFACAIAEVPESGFGVYKGNVTVRGYTDENVAENAGKTGVYEHGIQVGIWKE